MANHTGLKNPSLRRSRVQISPSPLPIFYVFEQWRMHFLRRSYKPLLLLSISKLINVYKPARYLVSLIPAAVTKPN